MARLGIVEKAVFTNVSGITKSFFEPNIQEQERLMDAYKKL